MLRILLLSLGVAPVAFAAAPELSRSLSVVFANERAGEVHRTLTSLADNQSTLLFLPRMGSAHEVSGTRWRSFTATERATYVRQMAPDTDATVCFSGDPASFARAFFASELSVSGLDGEVVASPSADGRRLGLALRWRGRPAHFRLRACDELVTESQLELARVEPAVIPKSVAGRFPAAAMPLVSEESGFLSVKADYEAAPRETIFPWRNFSVDASTPAAAAEQRFAGLMREYFADGKRFWCEAPWIDRISGAIAPEDLLPAGSRPPGAMHGQVLYNAEACRALGRVFGAPRTGIYNPPHWGAAKFEPNSFLAQLWYGVGADPIQIDLFLRDESFQGAGDGPWVRATFRPQPKMNLVEVRRVPASGIDRQIERARQNYETRYRGRIF